MAKRPKTAKRKNVAKDKRPNTPRFVLADSSITSARGHYLEYAVRVLEAVKDLGKFQPVLVANRVFDENVSTRLGFPTFASFSYDIWGENHTTSRNGQKKYGFNELEKRLLLSRANYAWALSKSPDSFRIYCSRFGASPHLLRWVRKAIEVRKVLATMHDLEGLSDVEMVRTALRERRRPNKLDSDEPEHLSFEYDIMIANNRSRLVANEIEAMIESQKLSSDDIVFMPTMGWHDLSGLTTYLEAHPDKDHPSFRLLFRRNVYDSSPENYIQDSYSVHDLKAAFNRLERADSKECVTVYTDTEELSDQYKTVYDRKIITAPIPIPSYELGSSDQPSDQPELNKSHGDADVAKSDHPLTALYLGDARREKGFHYLPQLVSQSHKNDSSEDFVENDISGDTVADPMFRVRSQVYFAPDFSDMEIIAAAEIMKIRAPEHCEVIEGVLDSERYLHELETADIIMIPYDQRQYAARSSGIFMEAVCYAKPTAIPAKSWMANIVDRATREYHEKIIHPHEIISQHGLAGVFWNSMSDVDIHVVQGRGLVLNRQDRPYFVAPCPPNATHFWIQMDLAEVDGYVPHVEMIAGARDSEQNAIARDRRIVFGGTSKVSIVIPCEPNQTDFWVAFSTHQSDSALSISDMTVKWLSSEAVITERCGSAVYTQSHQSDETADEFCEAVSTVASMQSAYKAGAVFLYEKMKEFHSPKQLAIMLTNSETTVINSSSR